MIGSTYRTCRHQLALPPQIAASARPACSSIAAATVPRRGQAIGGILGRDAAPSHQTLVVGQQRAEHVVILRRIEHAHAVGQVDAQPHLADLALDHRAPAEQDRPRDAVVHQGLRRAQHPFVLALAIDDAARRPAWPPRTPAA